MSIYDGSMLIISDGSISSDFPDGIDGGWNDGYVGLVNKFKISAKSSTWFAIVESKKEQKKIVNSTDENIVIYNKSSDKIYSYQNGKKQDQVSNKSGEPLTEANFGRKMKPLDIDIITNYNTKKDSNPTGSPHKDEANSWESLNARITEIEETLVRLYSNISSDYTTDLKGLDLLGMINSLTERVETLEG